MGWSWSSLWLMNPPRTCTLAAGGDSHLARTVDANRIYRLCLLGVALDHRAELFRVIVFRKSRIDFVITRLCNSLAYSPAANSFRGQQQQAAPHRGIRTASIIRSGLWLSQLPICQRLFRFLAERVDPRNCLNASTHLDAAGMRNGRPFRRCRSRAIPPGHAELSSWVITRVVQHGQ